MATVYVSPTGNDANTYAQAQVISTPWLTLAKCESSAITGDTIIMLNGTYTAANTTFTKNFTIQAQTNGSVIYSGGGAAPFTKFGNASSPTITVTGVTWSNYVLGSTDKMIGLHGAVGQILAGPNVTFNDCLFDNITTAAAFDARYGIFTDGGGNVTSANIHFLTFNRCVFRKIYKATSGALFNTRGWLSSTLTLNNCTLYSDGSGSTLLSYLFYGMDAASTLTIKNTIMYATSTLLMYGASAETKAVSYSDFYNFTSAYTGTGVITTDPLFVDAANNNFALRPTSPCVGTGTLS